MALPCLLTGRLIIFRIMNGAKGGEITGEENVKLINPAHKYEPNGKE